MLRFTPGTCRLGVAAALVALLAPHVGLRAEEPPPVSIALGTRQAHATPTRVGFSQTGGGNIHVEQPSPDTLVVTMTGVAVAGGHPLKDSVATLAFELSQCFDVKFNDPTVKGAKLTMSGQVVGMLRGGSGSKGGSARQDPGRAVIDCAGTDLAALSVPDHAVGGGESLSVNDQDVAPEVVVQAGRHTLRQTFALTAAHPRTLLHHTRGSAEFAPDPALDPKWAGHWEPFHGAEKKEFGFRVTVKVKPEKGAR